MIIDSPIISGSYAASGSLNQFGNVVISGSLTVTGSIFGTASFATTASYLSGYVSPFPFTGSAIISGSLTVTGSANIPNITGSLLGTSSFALTSSYSLSGGGFPYSGSAQITGSLVITNLSGSGVRYLVADSGGNITAQSASAALKSTQAFTATAGQTTFSVTNGYSTGYVDVFINGSKLNSTEFTDTSGTNIVLATGSFVDDIVEVVKYVPAAGVTNNVLRQLTTFTATAGQTVFSASYTPGLIDIFYNGARLSTSDYTANNGTFFTLATASVANDVLDVLVYSYQVGAFSGIGGQGVTSQIAYFNTTSSITGSNNFTISGSTMTVTGSLLVSGSGTFTNIGPAVMSGSLNVSGAIVTNSTITAQTLVVQTITSSVSVITGSTNWGSLSSNTHTFTGSIYTSGSIGINTNRPSASLHLSTTNGIRLQYVGNEGFAQFSTDSANAYIFSGYDGERMRLTSAGNLGIGTNNPSNILHVSSSLPRVISDTSTRFAVFNLYYQGAEKGGLILDNQNKLITLEANGDNTYDIRFNAGGSERMRITSAGVVDISNRNLSKGSMPAGSVIQVVNYQLNSGFSTTSGTDQDTGLNVSITPTSSTSKILVIVSANLRATGTGGNTYAYGKIWRGAVGSGTAIYDGFAMMGNYGSSDIRGIGNATILDSPATTSSTTYRFSINSQYAPTTYINSSTSPSTITVMEIAQ